ncbi:hypothetical protein T492DRAFT_1121548 [Pavlovales sp. CCMP2436]|nr:hypothetical protein T492DRAFT_1121548 [Pavlovales sp. CCMP2436]
MPVRILLTLEEGNDEAARRAAKHFDLSNSGPISWEALLDSVAKRTGLDVHRLKVIATHQALVAVPSASIFEYIAEWHKWHSQGESHTSPLFTQFELRDDAEGGGSCLVRMWGASGEDLAQSDVCEVAVLVEPTERIAIGFEGAEHWLRVSLQTAVDTLKDELGKCAPLQKTLSSKQYPLNLQQLALGGTFLADGRRTLASYGVTKEAVLALSMRHPIRPV